MIKRSHNISVCLSVTTFLLLSGCQPSTGDQKLFQRVSETYSGIEFSNDLAFDEAFNIYTYRNFYNGGGVAIGDINNDGLADIFFTGNQSANRLYLNKGNFKFEDVTDRAGVAGTHAWSTGVTMADVNGDGWLDIYVCNSGDVKGDNKRNELFINNGDLTFEEQAVAYGIADPGYTTHAAFFDYDNDGDLDLYILNNSFESVSNFNLRRQIRPERDSLGGDKLMRNDNGSFVDVSVKANVYGSVIGFGLGVTAGDINMDGWPDIYVSHDFFERDYLYINQRDGTFKEELTAYMKSISASSMGADMADVNNDLLPDVFVTDMLPEFNDRIKSVNTFQNWDNYIYFIENGYYHQFTRNSFQLNNGDSTFSEIGRMLGVHATDWSWGALIMDMNNDGLKDIFVANGIYKDLTDQDHLQYVSNTEIVKAALEGKPVNYRELLNTLPSTPLSNYAFENKGGYQFVNRAEMWGLDDKSFSNGAAYGDLDNDGDLDLVVNNVNAKAFVYRNTTEQQDVAGRFLLFDLKGEKKNTHGIGAKISVQSGKEQYYVENMPVRGFQSSMDPRPHVGVGSAEVVDQVVIQWPSGKTTVLKDVSTNQILKVFEKDAQTGSKENFSTAISSPLFKDVTKSFGVDYKHSENAHVDFDHDYLIFHMVTTEGPRVCKGDVNRDGLEDFFIGGAKDSPGALFIQTKDGRFLRSEQDVFVKDQASEDSDCLFFDSDNDGDLDLYVASGGNEFEPNSSAFKDRLYLNDGRGSFSKASTLPASVNSSTSTIDAADFDQDGDLDLFVGERLQPRRYGLPASGHILQNDGHGNFSDVTSEVAPLLKDIGMITDASWVDVDNDSDFDLVIVGEWMPLTVLVNSKGKFSVDKRKETNGWWNRLVVSDLDGDGDMDLIAGNHGLNSKFRGSKRKPVSMVVKDFDGNGDLDHVINVFNGDKSYPLILKHDLVTQIQVLQKKYVRFETYKDETLEDIFSRSQLEDAVKWYAYETRSMVFLNDGTGNFDAKPLPTEAQFSPVYGIAVHDVNSDGLKDILLGGNLYQVKPQVGRYDASFGHCLLGDGKGNFKVMDGRQSGWRIDGEVRDILTLTRGKEEVFLIARNNDHPIIFDN